ncbi:MAG TPA: rhombosortase [Thermoanaerobaculia bacterium]|nr:rhombosortase [Thermoanaerobaculia bacterium]
MNRIPWLTVTMASLSALLAGASLGGYAQYDRAALLRGEVWRLVTGHFAHWSFAHLAWDVLAFLILGALCERRRWLFASVILGTALIVSMFLFFCCPEVAMYRGLSSIDSALWMWGVFIIGERHVSLALTMLALFIAKVMVESFGVALFADGFTILPVLHLLGALAGFCGSIAEHKIAHFSDATLHSDGQRDRVRRRRDESAVVGGAV